jgi:hypothetical protein
MRVKWPSQPLARRTDSKLKLLTDSSDQKQFFVLPAIASSASSTANSPGKLVRQSLDLRRLSSYGKIDFTIKRKR